MAQLVRLAAALAVLATSGCFEEPILVLREAVPSPESDLNPSLFVTGERLARYEALRACSPCERVPLETDSGGEQILHVTPGVAYSITRDQIESAVIQQHYGFLSDKEFFYSLNCRISAPVLTEIFGREDRRGRAGLLIPFQNDLPLAYGTSGNGPCFLGLFDSADAASTRADALGLQSRRRSLSPAEIAEARSNEIDLAIDMVNFYICEDIPLEQPIPHDFLRARIPSDRREELVCDF